MHPKPVSVFKTNVQEQAAAAAIAALLSGIYAGNRVTFDLEDCDKVLRIENDVSTAAVAGLLSEQGYICEELQ